MEMLEKHLKDLFAAIIHCYQNRLLMPCLILLYAGIDVAASLEPSMGKGASISDYVDAEGRKGFFQISHRVYQRTGEPCPTCRTPIRRVTVTQRSSHFCPHCQKR